MFIEESTGHLHEYLARLKAALATLPEADLWWRPHDNTTSVGNLLLHLEGNVRQWIISGLGGADDVRRRASEFAARDGATKDALFAKLEATVYEACAVLESVEPKRLRDAYRQQGIAGTVHSAIYHVVEHFGWHAGQVVWIAKLRAGPEHGIAFYDDSKLE